MVEWTIVFWSTARQIAEEADLPPEMWPTPDVTPGAFFRTLREGGDEIATIAYVAAALPKLEGIEWGLASLPAVARDHPDFAPRMHLRDSARRWLAEPDDDNRRAIARQLEQADSDWPEALLGLAIFFSGGSIAPEDSPPVPADPHLTGQLVAGAMLSVAAEAALADPQWIERVLDLADRLATCGREQAMAS